jgi:TRAP-type C4-dicarboxylate transport system permease small subunit
MGLRLLPKTLEPGVRRIYRGVLIFFAIIFLAMVWPVVSFFSRVEPLILGLPFFLFYLAILLVGSFLVLLWLFLWEGRTGSSADPVEDRS